MEPITQSTYSSHMLMLSRMSLGNVVLTTLSPSHATKLCFEMRSALKLVDLRKKTKSAPESIHE